MPGREQVKRLSITVSSGSGTGTVTNQWDVARWIRVIPTTEGDTYTLTIKDADSHIMAKRTSQVGTFSERMEMSLGIIRTIEITSASADGTYTCKFDIH